MRIVGDDGSESVLPADHVRDVGARELILKPAKAAHIGPVKKQRVKTDEGGWKDEANGTTTGKATLGKAANEWQRLESRNHPGVYYYYNTVTGETSFVAP